MEELIAKLPSLMTTGTTNAVLNIVVGVMAIVFFFMFNSYLRKKAHEDTKKKRVEDQMDSIKENKEIFKDVSTDEESVEAWLAEDQDPHK